DGPRSNPAESERHTAGRRVAPVEGLTGDDGEDGGRVGDAPGMRSDRILRVRDRDDAGATGEADRRLDANDAAQARRADDTAVGFGTERGDTEVRRDGRSR